MTTLVHGAEETEQAKAAAAALFGGGDLHAHQSDDAGRRPARGRRHDGVPYGECPRVVDLLVEAGLAKSKGEARRTVAEGGAYLNNERVEDPERVPGRGRPARRRVARAAPREEELRGRRGPLNGAVPAGR